ncbi:hypothetical protein RHMOL_Rhmol07G0264800 [Rhododendron molle]|uniref:Uncharacterized protein n=1 Tax=Rhododendron molle TaxID=49168 RepID=A0ACC0N4W6_RHOML|nr:hypothetical protein RHMOL_Rhmol07G0264800 [Rhododendron molle]
MKNEEENWKSKNEEENWNEERGRYLSLSLSPSLSACHRQSSSRSKNEEENWKSKNEEENWNEERGSRLTHFMEGSSSGKHGSGNPDFEIFCYCGEPTPLRKSGTQKNPGRRFFGCANYEVSCMHLFYCCSLELKS